MAQPTDMDDETLLRAALRDASLQLAQVTQERDLLRTRVSVELNRRAETIAVARHALHAQDLRPLGRYLALVDAVTLAQPGEVV